MNKRTWRDAACEVVWNKVQKYFLTFSNCSAVWVDMYFSNKIRRDPDRYDIRLPRDMDFPTFHSAFMEWLDKTYLENLQKEIDRQHREAPEIPIIGKYI